MSRRFRFLLPFVLLAASVPPPAQAQSPVPDLEKEIRQRAAAIESKLIAWRRDIHEHPELPGTVKFIFQPAEEGPSLHQSRP